MAQTALRRGTQEDGNTEYFTGCPIGGGFIWYGLPDKIPSNCRICDNSTLAISSFAKLYENLDGAWGESGTNMNLPDLRGRFPRGVDGGAGNDPDIAGRTGPNTGQNAGDAVGSVQADAFKSHTHSLSNQIRSTVVEPYNVGTGADGSLSLSTSTGSTGESETRPKNANVYFVIRVE
jgi:microcystin-dependent protein